MTDDPDATSADLEIASGTVGLIGEARIGVRGVAATAPAFQGAPSGASATVVVVRKVAGVSVETTLGVREGGLLPLADGWHRVARIVPPGVRDNKGRIAVEREARQPIAPNAAVAVEHGSLRLGGPSVDDATDLAVLRFAPDDRSPVSADVEWRPAAFARKDTPPERIRQQSLKAGQTVLVPAASLKVAEVAGSTPEQPARIVFEIAPAR